MKEVKVMRCPTKIRNIIGTKILFDEIEKEGMYQGKIDPDKVKKHNIKLKIGDEIIVESTYPYNIIWIDIKTNKEMVIGKAKLRTKGTTQQKK